MVARNQQEKPASRMAAYTARNRAALLKSTQEVLSEVGLNATIEQLASHAQVSPTTIYNNFGNKDSLVSESLGQLWHEWVQWAYAGEPVGQSFQSMIGVCRKLFRVKDTHPLFANVLSKTLDNPAFVIDAVKEVGLSDLKRVSDNEGLASDNFDERFYLWVYCLAGILHGLYVTERLTPADADFALELSLQIWDISKAKAKKITSLPLDFPTTPE